MEKIWYQKITQTVGKILLHGQYNVEVDKGWVDSSRQAVEYCMDPRNFLNEVRLFQFEGLSYNANTNSLNGIEKILYGTEFYNQIVSYLDSSGNTITMNKKYSDLILKGGQTSYVSPYHLASRIKQEVGPFLSHSSISGKVAGYEGLYNFYNIGATSSSEPMGAVKNGLQYAKDGKGASQETKNKYLIPWNTKERSITGGAIFIGSSYINRGQNTIYLQKFHVVDDTSSELFWHQYMTNILAPYSESRSIYTGYNNSGLLNTPINFIIPIFNNMPNIPTDSPNINSNDFKDDNTKVYCNAQNVNIRTGPGTSYEIITKVSNQDKMTRIKKGIQSGEKWDKVILENGIIGYIYQSYVTETSIVKVTGIKLDQSEIYIPIGNTFKINGYVEPEDANDKVILYSSSNTEIAIVDENGVITANKEGEALIIGTARENPNIKQECKIIVVRKMDDSEISFDSSLTVNSLEISGINYEGNTVSDIKSLITTSLDIEFVNNKNELLADADLVGTGNKIRVKENGKILREYEIILYGDVNGDCRINSVDLLVLQRHILEIETMKSIYTKAANIRKTSQKPTSIDLLLIQRHILGFKIIEQSYMNNISYGSYTENIYLSSNNEVTEEPGIITQQNNTNLETLAIENTLLYPAFDNNITNYNAEVSNDTTSLNILAIPEVESARAEIVRDNELKVGNNLIIINVTAKDGITKKVYKVNVYKRSQEEEILNKQEELENQKKLEQIYNGQE